MPVKYYEILKLQEGEINSNTRYQKIEAKSYKLMNGRMVQFYLRSKLFIWDKYSAGLPKLEVGDIIEGEFPSTVVDNEEDKD